MKKTEMKDIVNLAQSRGFVFPGSDIYGGLANAWDYGPYGSIMKENIKFLWQKEFVQKKHDMLMIDSAILMNSQVWVASGHVGGFSDPLIDDKNTKERFRADKLLEDLIDIKIKRYIKILKLISQSTEKNILDTEILEDLNYIWSKFPKDKGNTYIEIKNDIIDVYKGSRNILEKLFIAKYSVNNLIPESWPLEKQTEVMRGESVKNPNTGNPGDWTEAKKFNLMFQTSQGVTQDSSATIYLRPETAQGIFVNFQNIVRTSRKKLPFGVAQVGKAFRNEITPGNFIFRTREFEQMEIEYFCEPGKDLEEHAKWKDSCMNFLTDVLGIKKELLRLRDHDQDELSHYSNATSDIEFLFPFGWGELWGIADRTDFDLKAHMKESKQDLSYFDPVNNKKYIPYVIEPSVGLTRLFLACLSNAYTIDEENERTYLKLDPKIAPIKVGVLPVVKKLSDIGKKVYEQLAEDFICEYDEVGSIGKRYARFDEIGTPFCVTVDSQNYEEGNITIRYRDSMEQEIISLEKLNNFIKARI